jgi:hypothetical protein
MFWVSEVWECIRWPVGSNNRIVRYLSAEPEAEMKCGAYLIPSKYFSSIAPVV